MIKRSVMDPSPTIHKSKDLALTAFGSTMSILRPQDQQTILEKFNIGVKRDVIITLFTQRTQGALYVPGRECKTCLPTLHLLEELCALSPKLHLEVVDYYGSQEDAKARGVDKIPVILIGVDGGDNVRFYGLPSGFTFALLIDTIIATANKNSSLKLETRRQLKELREDVHIQVFVTANSQLCPAVARVAHAMGMASLRVVADVVEIREFPVLAQTYNVMSVPKTVINHKFQFNGVVSEEEFLGNLVLALDEEDGSDIMPQDSRQVTPITVDQ